MKSKFLNSWLALVVAAVVAAVTVPAAQAETKTVVVFGASGKIGGLIVDEALRRGHKVVGISRNPEGVSKDSERFSVKKGDITDVDSFRSVTSGADAVIISVSGTGADNTPENSVHAQAAKTAAAAFGGNHNTPYVLQIGGATTMYETREAMAGQLPFKAPVGSRAHSMFFGHLVALETYRASDINWTVLTPPFGIRGWTPKKITNAEGTGSYRTSTDGIIMDEDGKRAGVMVADLALAAVEEIENQRFKRQRFTVAN